MRAEASSAGYYHSEVMNRDYPRIQVMTIEELMQNPELFKIPPGGDYAAAPRFQSKGKPQADIFAKDSLDD